MGVLALAGVWVAAAFRVRGRGWLRNALGLASGFMLAFALVEILPDALEQSPQAHIAAAVGFVVFYMIERLFDIHLCPAGADECAVPAHGDHSHAPLGPFALFGLGIHAVIDGLAIGGALVTSWRLAVLVTVAVALHKLPDGFCLGSLLGAAEEPVRFPWGKSLLFSAATPIGVLAAYAGLVGAQGPVIGLVLGFAAGSFLYVAAADLLPEAHHDLKGRADRTEVMLAVIAGALVAMAASAFGGA